MSSVVVNPRIRGFICTSAHPEGCARNVAKQIAVAAASPGPAMGNVLVVGSSAGYGLSSLITSVWGHGAKALAVSFERPAQGDRTASAGWYNLAAVTASAKAAGKQVETLIGDAFSAAIKDQAIAALKARFGKIDLLVYSLASPKRTDHDGVVHSSCLKTIGEAHTSKTVDLDTDVIKDITLTPSTEAEIAGTVKVMGGEDWQLWIDALSAAGLLAPGFRTVAYSYIGPKLTAAMYRSGTIGRAKDHLEATGRRLNASLATSHGGGAWVSVNKALVTQASSAIPVVPLYTAILYQVMRAKGTHEGTIEQMVRLFRDHLTPGRTPVTDAQGRIRVDDLEMAEDVQAEVHRRWAIIDTSNLSQLSDYTGFKKEFRNLFGFEVDGIDYAQPVEVERALG